MKGAVLYGPRDVRYVEREDPKIVEPTDVILRLSATCICGSDLWPYRGIDAPKYPAPMGHEYCGIVEEGSRRSCACHSLTAHWSPPPRSPIPT
jgi:threonine dehydrogenase-like Zn-dependent dehydrogenase